MQALKHKAVIIRLIIISIIIFCTIRIYEYRQEGQINHSYNGTTFSVKLLSTISNEISFSDNFHGEPYIITYFASWCKACKQNIEFIKTIRLHNPGVKIFGILFSDSKEQVQKIKEYNNLFDDVFKDFNNQSIRQFEIQGIPITLIIDKNNKVAFYYLGTLNNHVINKFIVPILNN